MNIDRCAFTGYGLKYGDLKAVDGQTIVYETPQVGLVKITLIAYQQLLSGNYQQRYLIAGLCKHRTIRGEDALLIDTEFITSGYKKLNPPTEFEEKCKAFLRYLYQNGGKENKSFDLKSTLDSALAYADKEEFARIVDALESDHFITYTKKHPLPATTLYMGVKLTSRGKEEAKKGLPQMPLFGLVSQQISTGDIAVDTKINHAKELFFSEPQTLDKMRSACETLSYIVEPIREELKKYFTVKDVAAFFQIVNEFDIRHNKDTTKNIIHEEQLEWVFYSLLNTINTYTKLKEKHL